MSLPHHVIILGCGRSGTSIFGELFEHLTPYRYYSEPPFADLLTYDHGSPVAVKVPKESTDFPPTPGLSFPLDKLLETVPAPRRLYWQVRHPLDTICSLRVGIAQGWDHHPRPPDWQAWLSRSLLERCAYHWSYLNSVGFASVADQATVTRFEDMITDPLSFAQRISQEVGLDVVHHHTSLVRWSQRVQNTNNGQFVEAKTSQAYSRDDHTVRVNRWKENLSQEEIEQITPLVEVTARRIGYTTF